MVEIRNMFSLRKEQMKRLKISKKSQELQAFSATEQVCVGEISCVLVQLD